MVPLQGLALEHHCDDNGEYGKGYDFLDNFELHEGERPSVVDESYPVCRNLSAVFQERYSPGEKYYHDKRPAR